MLHPNANTPFLREHTLFSVDKLEVQANRFAVCLTYPSDYLMQEFDGCTVLQIAQALRLPADLIRIQLEIKKAACKLLPLQAAMRKENKSLPFFPHLLL